jgi:hypothetical protein
MIATLYIPQQPPQAVPVEGLYMPDPVTGFARVPEQVPGLLGCAPGLVDVLACGSEYVAYSVFDCESETNQAAMAAVAAVSGVAFDTEDEDAVLRGAVLIVSMSSCVQGLD